MNQSFSEAYSQQMETGGCQICIGRKEYRRAIGFSASDTVNVIEIDLSMNVSATLFQTWASAKQGAGLHVGPRRLPQ
jgi:hypothetical protein